MATTREFIEKTYNTTSTRERSCSSVFTDMNGTVYSYGYHYPLAFHVKGLDFINTSGYSVTTGRHIMWAKQALNYQYIGVELSRNDTNELFMYTGTIVDEDRALEKLYHILSRKRQALADEMRAKKRKDTIVYAHLQREHDTVQQNMNLVAEAGR